jgi:hypothetical protein
MTTATLGFKPKMAAMVFAAIPTPAIQQMVFASGPTADCSQGKGNASRHLALPDLLIQFCMGTPEPIYETDFPHRSGRISRT